MSLTTAAEIQLRNVDFVKGFKDQRDIWLAMAREAYGYTKGTITTGVPKRDDVAPHVALALEARDEFLLLKSKRRARAKVWFRLFADLIIDQTWPEIVKEQGAK